MNGLKIWGVLGALNALLAVAAGAFGAHALKARLPPELLTVFETGARYHLFHALALLALAALSTRGVWATGAGIALQAGIVLFSFSLYGLALTQSRALGIITPVGGLSLIVGWALLALSIWRAP